MIILLYLAFGYTIYFLGWFAIQKDLGWNAIKMPFLAMTSIVIVLSAVLMILIL